MLTWDLGFTLMPINNTCASYCWYMYICMMVGVSVGVSRRQTQCMGHAPQEIVRLHWLASGVTKSSTADSYPTPVTHTLKQNPTGTVVVLEVMLNVVWDMNYHSTDLVNNLADYNQI